MHKLIILSIVSNEHNRLFSHFEITCFVRKLLHLINSTNICPTKIEFNLNFDFKKLVLADTIRCIRKVELSTLVLTLQPLIYPLTSLHIHKPTNTFYHLLLTHSCAVQYVAFQPTEANIYRFRNE